MNKDKKDFYRPKVEINGMWYNLLLVNFENGMITVEGRRGVEIFNLRNVDLTLDLPLQLTPKNK